ncbi:hypothetical protein Misp01_35660 [Microtetraspora sp. NBRC 13810]|nr:hypothetical protein Misp01_35660 [Microtetraspora sp. NBRC 13810]
MDAGGTSTRAVVASLDGTRAARGQAAGGNPTAHGVAASCAAIAHAVGTALAAYGAAGAQVRALVAGVAGGDPLRTGAGKAAFDRVLAELGVPPGVPVRQIGDVPVAFAAGTAEPSGTVLISGTGAVAAAIEDRGLGPLADGLGWLLGDHGSGYWIGRRAAQAVVTALATGAPATSLTTPVAETILHTPAPSPHPPDRTTPPGSPLLGGAAPPGPPAAGGTGAGPGGVAAGSPSGGGGEAGGTGEGGIGGVAGRALANRLITVAQSRPPLELAALAPLVSRAAAEGDAVALRIAGEAARLLTDTVAAVRPPGERTPVVLAGSVLTSPGPVRQAVRDLVRERWDAAVTVAGDGASAAAWLAALELLGDEALSLHPRLVSFER